MLSFSQKMCDLLGAVEIPSYGWSGTKVDTEYRQRFSFAEDWWRDLGFASASDAFKSIPEILAVTKSEKGTSFHRHERLAERRP